MSSWSRRHWLRTLAITAGGGGLAWLSARPKTTLARDEEIVLEQAHSPYNHIVVTERGSVRTLYFVVDGTYYIESRYDTAHPRSLDLDYTRTMMAGFLVRPKPRSLLMIGFGGGQISNYLFERIPGLEVDGVDIDGEVIRLARSYFGVPKSPRYRTHAADGRAFIERSDRRWDMIVLDAFRGVVVPEHLKTREFYRVCLQHLTPDGVVVANLHDNSGHYADDRLTFASVFPTQYAFASESGRQTSLVACASERWRGTYELRQTARTLRDLFDFDVLGLAARHRLHHHFRGGTVVTDAS